MIFVDSKKVQSAVEQELKNGPLMLSISYNSDLLVFERLTGMVQGWIDFAVKNPEVTIELRTKSSIVRPFKSHFPVENFQLSYSLSPDYVIKQFEKHTPKADSRINAIKRVTDLGWKVRLCFDPVILFPGWKDEYKRLVKNVFELIDPNRIIDVTIGPFRMAKEQLKMARKRRPRSALLAYPYKLHHGLYSYPKDVTHEIGTSISHLLTPFIDKKKVHVR